MNAKGTFEVTLLPQTDEQVIPLFGRRTIDKDFQGDLQAASRGQMLSFGTGVHNSAGYVAMERVEGTLHGKRGSFVLQHSGTMNKGVPALTVSVVPDSGTEELLGLSGTLEIHIADGTHYYDFNYYLPHFKPAI